MKLFGVIEYITSGVDPEYDADREVDRARSFAVLALAGVVCAAFAEVGIGYFSGAHGYYLAAVFHGIIAVALIVGRWILEPHRIQAIV